MLRRLRAGLRKVGETIATARRRIAKQSDRAEQKRKGWREAQEKRRAILARVDEALERGDAEAAEKLKRQAAELSAKAQSRHAALNHKREYLRELRSRLAWAIRKRTRLRRKLRRAREVAELRPEAWQANGHEWHYLSDRAKRLLAIAVVRYDLACTSIYRDWGTGSHHEEIPTRGFDCAGARMAEFQRDLRYGRIEGFELGDLLELFGPDNRACADNGQALEMAEGSDNETLHDSHVHAFVYGR